MTNITSNANRRTTVKYTSVPTNYGSRITRAIGHTQNALGTLYNATFANDKLSDQAILEDLKNAGKASWKWLNTDPTKAQGSSVSNQSNNTKSKKFGLQTNGAGGGIGTKGSAGTPPAIPIQSDPDETYRWNLPPHTWSLPKDPGDVSDSVVAGLGDFWHTNRRGKIFLARKYVGTTATTDAKTGNKVFDRQGKNNYGFQFLWNPETFSQSTSVNWGITPEQNDATAILTGLTTANSTISLTLRIDRTNDFAAFGNRNAQNFNVDNYTNYYQIGQAPNSNTDFATNMEEKIIDLTNRGTEADLEFLYKTINGDGYKTQWGTTTSNISFLLPTIVRVDLGPQRLVGMIQSVDVNHLAFTRGMIPIRTDVTLSIDLRTAAGLTTSNFGVDAATATSVATK